MNMYIYIYIYIYVYIYIEIWGYRLVKSQFSQVSLSIYTTIYKESIYIYI